MSNQPNPAWTQIAIRLPRDVAMALKKRAKRMSVSVPALLRSILTEIVKDEELTDEDWDKIKRDTNAARQRTKKHKCKSGKKSTSET